MAAPTSSARLAPAVIVHGAAMARWAVGEAAVLGLPLTLLSAPGAGAYAGAGWWRALMHLADPACTVEHMLDCGDAPGRALEALRAGQRLLCLRADGRIWADIAERARAAGGWLAAAPPPALDLANPHGRARLAAWLRQSPVPDEAETAATP